MADLIERLGRRLALARSIVAAYRRADTAPLPSVLDVDADLDLRTFARIVDEARPARVVLSGGEDPLRNPALPELVRHATNAGAEVTLRTDGTLLDPGRSYALLDAGLGRLKVTRDTFPEKVLRNVERLVAMRDANRKPGPAITLELRLSAPNLGELLPLVEVCHTRFTGIEPAVLLVDDPSSGDALRDPLGRARAIAREHGLGDAARSMEAALAALEGVRDGACHVPWSSARVAGDGEVYPCRAHALQGASFGSVLREPLPEAWNGARSRAFRARLRARRSEDAVCAACRHEDTAAERVFAAVARVPALGGLRTPA